MATPDPAELRRKVRQHDDDLEAVYGLLHTLDRKVDAVDLKVDTVDRKVDTGFTDVAARFTEVEQRLNGLADGQQAILRVLGDLRREGTAS